MDKLDVMIQAFIYNTSISYTRLKLAKNQAKATFKTQFKKKVKQHWGWTEKESV